jgi:hypothetical protein
MRLAKDRAPHLSREDRRNSVFEKDPHVRAVAGARSFQVCRHTQFCARLDKRHRIFLQFFLSKSAASSQQVSS